MVLKNSTKVFTKKGTLRKKYKDLPRYKVIFEYEKSFIKEYEKTLNKMNKQIISSLTKALNK